MLSFGPFRLHRHARELCHGTTPVRLGGRALDLLRVLVEHAGDVVSHAALERAVWPGAMVEDSCLRVQIGALRRALGDSPRQARYIANVPGRGYSFVAPVLALPDPAPADVAPGERAALPPPRGALLGRDEVVQRLLAQRRRLTTIVGPGGIGKTTLALALARARLPGYLDGACLVDLAPCTHASLVAGAVAAALGIMAPPEGILPALTNRLAARRMLIVFDNCEHVSAAASALIEHLLAAAPGLDVVATSREPLHAHDEWVERLAPLACPPDHPALTLVDALTYPALAMLLERASYILHAREVATAGALCRRLEGVPLALEFGAARVKALGLEGALACFARPAGLLDCGWRTALLRQRSLRASLDWSLRLLEPAEWHVLRACAAIDGPFTVDQAGALPVDGVDRTQVGQCVQALVDKSLLTACKGQAAMGTATRLYLQSLTACSHTAAIRSTSS